MKTKLRNNNGLSANERTTRNRDGEKMANRERKECTTPIEMELLYNKHEFISFFLSVPTPFQLCLPFSITRRCVCVCVCASLGN